jgi:hypothetical protein
MHDTRLFSIERNGGAALAASSPLSWLLILATVLPMQLALAGGHTQPGPDSDSDGFNDYIESRLGTDPNDDTSVPQPIDDIWIDFEAGVPASFFTPSDTDAGWARSDEAAKTGEWSLQSTDIENDQTAAVVWPVLVGDSKLIINFWEFSGDKFFIYVDDVLVFTSVTKPKLWTYNKPATQLTAGYHEIRFEFSRNFFSSGGCDCTRIDNLRILDQTSDNDGLPDVWELEFGLDPNDPTDELLDLDNDGLTNLEEFQLGSLPNNSDSDADGVDDSDEVNVYGTDLTDSDTDDDTLFDGDEISLGLDPLVPSRTLDADGDGVSDYVEVRLLTDPFDSASTPAVPTRYLAGFEPGLPPNWFSPTGVDLEWFRTDADGFESEWSLESEQNGAIGASIVIPILVSDATLTFRYLLDPSCCVLNVFIDDRRVFGDRDQDTWQQPTSPISIPAGYHEIRFQFDGAATFPGAFARIDNVYIEAVDIDRDGMSNDWESDNGFNPLFPGDGILDADGDGLSNADEFLNLTDPHDKDSDNDKSWDAQEVNVLGSNPNQFDTDGDSISDGYEFRNDLDPLTSNRGVDSDDDGIDDTYEYVIGTDPQVANPELPIIDGYFEGFESPDGLDIWFTPDGDIKSWFRNDADALTGDWSFESELVRRLGQSVTTLPVRVYHSEFSFNYQVDSADGDRLRVYVDGQEILNSGRVGWTSSPIFSLEPGYHEITFVHNRNNRNRACKCMRIDDVQIVRVDFDRDGLPDVWEIEQGLDFEDPSDATVDNDFDGLNNLEEFGADTPAFDADADDDGLLDGEEVNTYGTSPHSIDTDGDQLPDGWEVSNGNDPNDALDRDSDRDGDGVPNRGEFYLGTDPSDINSVTPFAGTYVEDFETELPDFWVTPLDVENGWHRTDADARFGEWSLQSDPTFAGPAEIILPVRVRESRFRVRTRRNSSFSDSLAIEVDGEVVWQTEFPFPFVTRAWQYTPWIKLDEGYHEVRFVFSQSSGGAQGCACGRIDLCEIFERDADMDGLRDTWELQQGLDPGDPNDALLDNDFDGLINLDEFAFKTDPFVDDSDTDGILDGMEVNTYGTDPSDPDTDKDNMPDGWEVANGTNPTTGTDRDTDADGDGVPNIGEFYLDTDASDINSTPPFMDAAYVESFEDTLPAFWATPINADASWQRSNEAAWEGTWSLVSDPIESGEVAEIVLPVMVRESTLRSRVFRNTNITSNVFIYVDNIEVYNSSNLRSSWSFTPKIPLSEGYHEIRFEFQKPFSTAQACDCGRIDLVEVLPVAP